MPGGTNYLKQGCKRWLWSVKYQFTHNTVKEAYEQPATEGKKVGRAAQAVGLGAMHTLVPPVAVAFHAVREYRKDRELQMNQTKMGEVKNDLLSHGISDNGATTIALLIVKDEWDMTRISASDMWQWYTNIRNDAAFANEYAQYTERLRRCQQKLTADAFQT